MDKERTEALWRILIGIVTGIIIHFWRIVIGIVVLVHLVYVLITGKRSKAMAEFCQVFNDVLYKYVKYVTFASQKRVFPFADLGKPEKTDIRK